MKKSENIIQFRSFSSKTARELLTSLVNDVDDIQSIALSINWKDGITTATWSEQTAKDLLFASEKLNMDIKQEIL